MYDSDLAMTGIGAIVIGPLVVQAWWAVAALVGAGLLLVVASRALRRRRARAMR